MLENSLNITGHYEILTACDGIEGLGKYKSFNPDIIVADVEMPKMNDLLTCIT